MRPPVDLAAYCRRIGYAGPLEPTLPTLRALHRLHPASIPFENLDVLAGGTVDLAPAAIDAKLVGRRRGGFCFEHNALLKRVLIAIGFEVEGLLARVRWMEEPGAPPRPPTHMALRVTIEGRPWLADVGFGSCVPTAPLRLDTEELQPTDFESYRIRGVEGGQRVEALIGEVWRPLYDFAPHAVADIDYEPGNWYVCTHPLSHFLTSLMVARAGLDARCTLRNSALTVRHRSGEVEERNLDRAGIEAALAEQFGIEVDPNWRPALERAAASA
jgi:N-hydroxyarylamine O-acetyltransferase